MEYNLEPLKAMHLQSVHIGYNRQSLPLYIDKRKEYRRILFLQFLRLMTIYSWSSSKHYLCGTKLV